MSFCFSGMSCVTQAKDVLISVSEHHPLIRLSRSLPWESVLELVLPDLKKTKHGCWWLGRKLKLRIHLGVYLLQQLFNKTDRQIEYDVKDNAAYQIFCGHGIVEKWHAPDHTKIESFRSHLSETTQQLLANFITQHAVALDFADPSEVDIDSTIQEANMQYPADSCLLKKLGTISNKVARAYFFLPKNSTKEVKDCKLLELLHVVQEETRGVIDCCKKLDVDFINRAPWGIRRTIEQLTELAAQYLKDVQYFLTEGSMAAGKIMSFH